MSISYLICSKCGKSSRDKEFIDAFCIDCSPIDVQVPKESVFEICTVCRRTRRGNEWADRGEKEIGRYVIRKCRGQFSNAIYDGKNGIIIFFIKKSGKILKISKPVNVQFIKTICRDCSRISGGYYEAIIQLRGSGPRVNRLARTIEMQISRNTFISKVEEKKEGIDIYIGSTTAALAVIKELGYRHIISKKLVGVNKEGRRQYRTTFSIRLE